jgi:hypothetical protein
LPNPGVHGLSLCVWFRIVRPVYQIIRRLVETVNLATWLVENAILAKSPLLGLWGCHTGKIAIDGVKKVRENLDCDFEGFGVGTSSIAILGLERL